MSRELSTPRDIQAGQRYQVALGCRAHVRPHHSSISLHALILTHTLTPSSHCWLRGKRCWRFLLGHHKQFFYSRRKTHFPPTITTTPPASLLPSTWSRGLCSRGHEGLQNLPPAITRLFPVPIHFILITFLRGQKSCVQQQRWEQPPQQVAASVRHTTLLWSLLSSTRTTWLRKARK